MGEVCQCRVQGRLSGSGLGLLDVSCKIWGGGKRAQDLPPLSRPLFSWGITPNTGRWGKEPVPSSSGGQRPSVRVRTPEGPQENVGPRLCPLPALCLHRARRDSSAPSFDWRGGFGSQPRKSCQGWRLRVKRKASNVLSRAGPVDIEGPDGAGAWGTVEMEAAYGECTGPEGGVGHRNCISCQ